MTTAASIWITAATGMVAGCGYAGAALGLSLLTRFVLAGIYAWEAHFIDQARTSVTQLTCDPDHGRTAIRIAKMLDDHHVSTLPADLEEGPEGAARLRLVLHLTRRRRRELLAELAALPAVREIRDQPQLAGAPPQPSESAR